MQWCDHLHFYIETMADKCYLLLYISLPFRQHDKTTADIASLLQLNTPQPLTVSNKYNKANPETHTQTARWNKHWLLVLDISISVLSCYKIINIGWN